MSEEHYALKLGDANRPGTIMTPRAICIHGNGVPKQPSQEILDYWTVTSTHDLIDYFGNLIPCIPAVRTRCEEAHHGGSTAGDYTALKALICGRYDHPRSHIIAIEHVIADRSWRFSDATWKTSVRRTAFYCREWDLDPFRDVIHHAMLVDPTHWPEGRRCVEWFINRPAEFERYRRDVYKEFLNMGAARAA